MQETGPVISPDGLRPPRMGRKYPTKATKLEFLEFVVGCRGADVVTATQRFHLSPSGARGKFRRLVRQGLLETIPDTYGRTNAWQLTKNGQRHLAHLREAMNYAGTKSKLIESLKAEVIRLEAENNHLQKVVENTSGILQKGAGAANENAALKRAKLREAEDYGGTKSKLIEILRAEVKCLKAENYCWQKVIEATSVVLEKGADLANENVALRRALNESRAENRQLEADIVTCRRTLALRMILKP